MNDLPMVGYLNHFRCYYPGILEWYSGLKDELLSGRRSVFVFRKGSEIQGLAITKNGSSAKLCHISVSPTARERGIGGTLMRLALAEMKRRGAKEIHVTTGEEVFRDHAEFFRLSGFGLVDWRLNRYRPGASELIWKMTVKPAPWWFEQTPLLGIEDKHQFYCEANEFSSHPAWLPPAGSPYEHWFSKQSPRSRGQSQSNDLWPICDADHSPANWFPVNSDPAWLECAWRISAPDLNFCKHSTGLHRLFRYSDSRPYCSLPLLAEAVAPKNQLDDFGKTHLWNCHQTDKFED